MNSKTAKLLSRVAGLMGGSPRELERLKAQWKGTPKPHRGRLRRTLQATVRELEARKRAGGAA